MAHSAKFRTPAGRRLAGGGGDQIGLAQPLEVVSAALQTVKEDERCDIPLGCTVAATVGAGSEAEEGREAQFLGQHRIFHGHRVFTRIDVLKGRRLMLRKILLAAAASVTLLPQPSLAVGGADVAASQRWTAAAYASDPEQRCANVYGGQYWFLGATAPNCVQPNVERPYNNEMPRR